MKEEILRIENAAKEKDHNELLRCVYLQVFKGEILGVIFDNIQEKQCMIDILRGKSNFDYGRLYYNNRRLNGDNVQNVLKNNIAVIERTSNLIDNLTVSENVFVLGNNFKKFLFNSKLYENKTKEVFREFDVDIQTENNLKKLTSLEKVMVALIKAYASGKSLILLKDITGFLNSMEIEKVLKLMLKLKGHGMSFILIETYEDIVFEHTDELAIIKNGKTIGIFQSAKLNRQKIYSVLTEGKNTAGLDNIKLPGLQMLEINKVAMSFQNICTEVLQNVSFEVKRGEIVKLLYMDDPSYEHIIGLLKGGRKALSGKIYIDGKSYDVSGVWNAVLQGICFIEENPLESMLFYEMSVLDNLCFTMSNKVRGMWIKNKYRKSIIKTIENVLGKDILSKPLSHLSPVILQKIAYCKWLLYAPGIVICIKPFSAVDIHVRQATEQMIRLLTDRGIAVLILTSNISEIYHMDGKIFYIRDGRMIDEDEVYQLIYGMN